MYMEIFMLFLTFTEITDFLDKLKVLLKKTML